MGFEIDPDLSLLNWKKKKTHRKLQTGLSSTVNLKGVLHNVAFESIQICRLIFSASEPIHFRKPYGP